MTPEQLKEYRLKKGLSQAKFAKKAGVSQSNISRWEKGIQSIPDMLDRLVECWEGRKG